MAKCAECGIEIPKGELDVHLNSKHPEVANDPVFRNFRRDIELLARQAFDTGVTKIQVPDIPQIRPFQVSGIILASRSTITWSTPTI